MWRHRAPWGALAGPLGLTGVGAAAPAPWAVFGGMTCAVTGRREGEQGTIRSPSLAASWGWRGHPQQEQRVREGE